MKAKKISVAFISKKMDHGGIEKAALDFLKQLNPDRYDVDYYYRRRPHEKEGELLSQIPFWIKKREIEIPTIKNYRYLYFGMKERVLFWINYAISYCRKNEDQTVQYSSQARLAVKKKKEYDIAISFDGPTAYGVFYTIEAISARIKVLWIHGDVREEGAVTPLVLKYYSQYNRIITVSRGAKDVLLDSFKELNGKVSVVYNYVDYKKIRELSIFPNEIVSRLFHSFQGLKICTVGRLGNDKGMILAAETCKLLKKQGVIFRWAICGEGPERELLEKYIIDNNLQEYLYLVGNQNNPYVFISNCDIYVQPSIREGFCTTTNEARVLCKPVITTDVCGMSEQFHNDVDGMIVKQSPDELCKAIIDLWNNPLKRKIFTDQLSSIIWEECQQNLGSVIDEILMN